jgi:hypothetical protein
VYVLNPLQYSTRNQGKRRRGRERLAWKWLKKWDLLVFEFCGRAKMALDGCEGGTQRKNATRGLKRRLAGVYSTVLGNPKWKSERFLV